MEQFQHFWHHRLSHLDSQLQLDFDTFLTVFAQEIKYQTSIQLTPLQQQIIKAQIDPQNQNQVYKSGYLLFVRNFWAIPSERTKFFNMKTNLSKLKGQPQLLPMAGWIKVKIRYVPYFDHQQIDYRTKSKSVTDEYLIQNDEISIISTNRTNQENVKKKNLLLMKGFVTIGSSQQSDIVIPSSSVNSSHFKIIYCTNLQLEGKSTPSFERKPKPRTKAFIRDVSSSNRLKYIIDNENKYFILKSNMTISGFGLIEGLFQIEVQSAPNVEQAQIKTMLQSLNADRKSFFIGQADKPEKVAINMSMEPLNQFIITDLYDRGLYYPQQKEGKININKEEKGKKPLKLVIRNKRTLQQCKFDSKAMRKLTVGRNHEKCDIVIDHISIRPIEFILQCLNNIWMLRPIEGKQNLQGYKASVYLTHNFSRCSNRQKLSGVYIQKFGIKKDVEIQIEVKQRQKQQNEDELY